MSSCFTDISELGSEISLKLLKLFISVQACMFCGCSSHSVPRYLHFTWMVHELRALVYKNHSIWKFSNCFTLKPIWPVNNYRACLSLSSVCNIPLVAVSQEVANMTQWKVTLWDLTLPHQQEIVTNVLEECNATFFRVKHCSSTAWPWSCREFALPKCWQLNSSQHNDTSQKTWIFEGCTVCICCCL